MRTLFARPALLLALLGSAQVLHAEAMLDCQFQARTHQGRHELQFTLHNRGKQDLYLLRWGSPFEDGWFGRFAEVEQDGQALPYQGAMRKRGEPGKGDYLLIKAGQTLRTTQTLEPAYSPRAGGGPLAIHAHWTWHDVVVKGMTKAPRPRDQHQSQEQDCGKVNL